MDGQPYSVAGDDGQDGGGRGQRSETVMVSIAALRTSDSPRRDGESPEHIRTLVESGAPLPPITVHRATMRVIDGMHRLRAAQQRGETEIAVRFFDGDEKDAFVLAVRENVTHGLPLTLGDRRRAAARIIDMHPQWSNRAIAAATGLAANTIGTLRRATAQDERLPARIGRDGRVRPVDGTQGRLRARDVLVNQPGTPIREVAQAAGVSVRTARDVRDRLTRGDDPLPARQRASRGDRATPQSSYVDLSTLLHTLKQDPSVRLNDAGRTLIRLLDAHLTPDRKEWENLLSRVPAHCGDAIVALARGCARTWHTVAEIVESSRSASTPEDRRTQEAR